VPVAGLDDLGGLLAAFRTVQAAEAWQVRGRWITANPGALAPDVEAPSGPGRRHRRRPA
jgi:amidase